MSVCWRRCRISPISSRRSCSRPGSAGSISAKIGTTTRARFGWIDGTHARPRVGGSVSTSRLVAEIRYRRDPQRTTSGWPRRPGIGRKAVGRARRALPAVPRQPVGNRDLRSAPRRTLRARDALPGLQGDLGVRLRGEMELFGGRPNAIDHFVWVPGDATYGASVLLTLLDANVTVPLPESGEQAPAFAVARPDHGAGRHERGLRLPARAQLAPL